jgi:hypothetical protein
MQFRIEPFQPKFLHSNRSPYSDQTLTDSIQADFPGVHEQLGILFALMDLQD